MTAHGMQQLSENGRWHVATVHWWRPSMVAHPCLQWWRSLVFNDLLAMTTSYALTVVRLATAVTLWFGSGQIQVGDGFLPVMATTLCGDRGLLTFRQWQDLDGRQLRSCWAPAAVRLRLRWRRLGLGLGVAFFNKNFLYGVSPRVGKT
jgi:hypothetical protein